MSGTASPEHIETEHTDFNKVTMGGELLNQKYAKISETDRVERQGVYSPCMLMEEARRTEESSLSWTKLAQKTSTSISSSSSLDDESGIYDPSEGDDELGDYMKPIRTCTIADIYMFEELRKEVGFETAREWALSQLGPKMLSEASTVHSSTCVSRVSSISSRPDTPAASSKDWRQGQRKGFSQSDGSFLKEKKKLLFNIMKQNSLPAKVFLSKMNSTGSSSLNSTASATILPGISAPPNSSAFNKKKLTTWNSWKQ